MSLTRLTLCLGLLILLSGVTAFSRQGGTPLPPDAKFVGIPKDGAGMIDTKDYIVIYDQGKGKGKLISKIEYEGNDPEPSRHKMYEFAIK